MSRVCRNRAPARPSDPMNRVTTNQAPSRSSDPINRVTTNSTGAFHAPYCYEPVPAGGRALFLRALLGLGTLLGLRGFLCGHDATSLMESYGTSGTVPLLCSCLIRAWADKNVCPTRMVILS